MAQTPAGSNPKQPGPNQLGYKPHPVLLGPIRYADGLARAVGPNCEVVVHDLRHPEKSLIHVAGNVTSRSIGAPVTNIVLESIRKFGDDAPDLFNYRTQGPNGHVLRSSTLFIRSSGRIIGALCINLDMTVFEYARTALDETLSYESSDREERFGNTVKEVLDDLLAAVLDGQRVRPLHMTPEDRLRFVAALEDRGVFQIRGSVEEVAGRLNVSKFTVYGYLKQVRTLRLFEADRAKNGPDETRALQAEGEM